MTIFKAPTNNKRVTSFRLLHELFTDEQQAFLVVLKGVSEKLDETDVIKVKSDENATNANGLPLRALMGIALAYQKMLAIRGDGKLIDLNSGDMLKFLQAVAACGVFGTDVNVINSEINRIRSNVEPG